MLHHSKRLRASDLSFCVVPYCPVRGEILSDIPDCCPYRETDPSRVCRIVRDHLRHRSTGPSCPLLVCRCQTHGRGYSLYPPGYGPYAREALVAVTSEGVPERVITEETRTDDEPAIPPDQARFQPTYLGAAVEAAAGRFWPRQAGKDGDVDLRYSTQIRRIHRGLVGLGLDPHQAIEDRFRISQHLGTGLVSDEEVRSELKVSANRSRASLVCRVLAGLESGWQAVRALTHAFYLAGMWGLPFFWDGKGRRLRTEPFRRSRTGGSPMN